MKSIFYALMIFLAAQAAHAFKLDKVKLKFHDALVGKSKLKLVLKKGLFRSEFETLELPVGEKAFDVSIDSLENVTAIDYELLFDSDINVGRADLKSARLQGRLVLKGKNDLRTFKVKKDDIAIYTSEKMKLDLDCENIVSASSPQTETLLIDLASFENLSSCSGEDAPYYSLGGIPYRNVSEGRNRYSLEDDKRLGREFVDEFESENADKILPEDHPMSQYMQFQMEKIAENSDMPDLKPRVRVINADVLNAFALPGGYVYIFRGLLEKAPNMNAVMGVLGHEWAHVTARHGTRAMTRAIRTLTIGASIALVGMIGSEFIDDEKVALKKLVSGASVALGLGGAQLYILDRGRDQELEADRLGSQYAQLAGFAPTGIATMFREFKRISPMGNTFLENIMSSHPHHDERIERNLVQSALFLPKAKVKELEEIEVDGNTINYEGALAQMTSMPLPSKYESENTASAFAQTLHSQNEAKLLESVRPLLESLQSDEEEE